MALDKQRILNELGSVMNQLQGADCGCMGKLFSNNGQCGGNMHTPVPTCGGNMNSPLPTCGGCRRGWCNGHGYGNNNGSPSAGEPYSMNNSTMNRPCMGHCNPPKLYADTYNYLNENFMQPVVKDVYNDLKTITPANTVTNNPMASQMGLSPQGDNIMGQNQMQGNAMENQNTSNMGSNMNAVPNNQQHMGQMGNMAGMGPNIVNMMMGDGRSKPSSQGHGGQLTESMIIDAPQSPHGQVGVTPLTPSRGINPGQYNMSMGQANPGQEMQNPTTQYMQQSQPNMYGAQGVPVTGNIMQNPRSQHLGQSQMSPATQQMAATNPSYGQHSPGMTKFNEMFPGVMQGGELGFDPMAIAIQMNPANHQKAAMDTMQKMMSGNKINTAMQPSINGANIADSQIKPVQQNLTPNNHMMPVHQPTTGTIPSEPGQIPQQLDDTHAGVVSQMAHVQQQQVYTAQSGAPAINQLAHQQQIQNQQPQQYQQAQQSIDPNTGAPMGSNLPTIYEGTTESNAQMPQQPPVYSTPQSETQPMIKDPIFPADTSSKNVSSSLMKRQKYYQYNTLGQPVEMLPASMYQIPEAHLPQTLSPQPVTAKQRTSQSKLYSNVKATVSKTSLMGNRPVGRVPSRGQLQQIYNQYKGSQSYTHQTIHPPEHGGTYSEGNLNVPQGNRQVHHEVPIEKVGGDSIANNNLANKVETVVGQKGDVPDASKPGEEIKGNPLMQSKCRNGLQDMIYTSYPTSAAWSFHGDTAAAFPTSYNFRSRV